MTKKNMVLGILAHVDAGKTTLSEQLLLKSGGIRKAGRVDHGDSFMDTDAQERERGITIFSKQAILRFGETSFTLLDTPGHVDFSAEMERSLQVLDYAILIVSAADGVQGHTETLWSLLKEYQVPTFVFANKMDQPGMERERVFRDIKENLSGDCVDFSLMESNPEAFFEAVATADEEMLEEFLASGQIEKERIVRAIAERKLFPCFFGSALKDEGIEELLEGISSYSREPVRGSAFGARVFKITRDGAGNRLVHMKITGGSLKVKTMLASANWEKEEKVNQIRIYHGDKFEPADEVTAGQICAVTGLSYALAGEGLGIEEQKTVPYLEPVLSYKVFGPKEMDAHTVIAKLHILEEEHPELHISWDEELSEIRAQLMGDVQIEVLHRMILDRFGFETTFDEGDVVYRESIETVVEGVGHFEPLRHYAEVHLIMEPLPRGSGLVFATDCREDDLALNWQRLIHVHLKEKQHRGVLIGAPITDMKITLVAGKAHTKHTEGGDFRQATYRAVRQGLMQAKSVLLEPYYAFRITVPADMVGRVLADMERMGGSFKQPDIQGQQALICGRAPVSASRNYAREIASFTGGRGRILLTPEGYDVCHNTEEVLDKKCYDPLRDVRNSSDSVFCQHGSGYIVPWDEVHQHMHIESVLAERKKNEFDEGTIARLKREAEMRSAKKEEKFGAADEELKAIFERTYGAPKQRAVSAPRTVTAQKQATEEWKKNHASKPHKVLEEYLLVDGYNIIFAWEELKELAEANIDAARGKLMDILCDYQGFKKCRLIVVFDAYKVKGGIGVVQKYHNIEVVYTKEAETADMYIEKAAHNIAKGDYRVTVATSDGLIQLIVWGQGCLLLSARELKEEIARAKEQMRQEYTEKRTEATNRMGDILKDLY
ncbi:MAG: GTP-binding protein [Lachnospiraceae bacterium]|nr:GTP-binding protein [Lachnospiraceae bacterium]